MLLAVEFLGSPVCGGFFLELPEDRSDTVVSLSNVALSLRASPSALASSLFLVIICVHPVPGSLMNDCGISLHSELIASPGPGPLLASRCVPGIRGWMSPDDLCILRPEATTAALESSTRKCPLGLGLCLETQGRNRGTETHKLPCIPAHRCYSYYFLLLRSLRFFGCTVLHVLIFF